MCIRDSGGMLMSIADYCLCSAAMESRENYAATVSFRCEFIAPAKVGRLLEIFPKIDKKQKVLFLDKVKLYVTAK